MVVAVNNEKGNDMSDERSNPDFTEVIDVTSLPNWSDPQVQATFAKIDEFLKDPSTGVTREFTKHRVPRLTPPAPEEADEFIEVNLNSAEGFNKAVEIVEDHVIDGHLATYDPRIADAAKFEIYDDLVAYLKPLPTDVLIGVIMQIANSAAGLAVQVAQQEWKVTAVDEPVV